MINTEGTKVWAHRGASGYAQENTLEAFKKAEKMKAMVISVMRVLKRFLPTSIRKD